MLGHRYRSVIFFHNDEQKMIAEKSLKEAKRVVIGRDSIVTEITKLNNYTDAEDYHDNYYDNNPNQPYCLFVIKPKVEQTTKRWYHQLA